MGEASYALCNRLTIEHETETVNSEGLREMVKQFGNLRLKEPLHAQIEEAARVNQRSMNAEINARLEQSFLWDAVRQIAKVRLGMVHDGKIDWEWFADNPQVQNYIARKRTDGEE